MTKREIKIKRLIYLSIATAVATIGLKVITYWLTKSVGLLSDALEAGVNLTAASIALIMFKIAQKPADKKHNFGHGKAEYFSSIIEGSLIIIVAGSILYLAIPKLFNPRPLENIDLGFIISLIASGLNLITARLLIKYGKTLDSIILEADGQHLMTDVWTSVGVVGGVLLVKFSGLHILDPILAILVAGHIIKEGIEIVSRSVDGLLDSAMPDKDLKKLKRYLNKLKQEKITYHRLQTRQSGQQIYIIFHMLVPKNWTIKKAHNKADQVEAEIDQLFEKEIITTIHIEPSDHHEK